MNFTIKVEKWVAKSERRALAVFKESTQRVLEQASVPTAKGGRMRVDTGFLRDSLDSSLSGMPVGPSRREEGHPPKDDADDAIARAKMGDTIYAGWTAEYARPREAYDGFAEAAAQDWDKIVRETVREAKRRFR